MANAVSMYDAYQANAYKLQYVERPTICAAHVNSFHSQTMSTMLSSLHKRVAETCTGFQSACRSNRAVLYEKIVAVVVSMFFPPDPEWEDHL